MLIFVIDHEKSRLTQLVQQISEAARAARDAKILEYASAVTAGDAISKWGIPDAVFLDADGWEREGCGFVRSVKEKDPQCRIILISDSDVYAMKAYAMNIERYLLRPFSSERIREEIQLLQTRRSKTNYEENERAGTNEKIRVRCFGSFAVFWQNKPLLLFCNPHNLGLYNIIMKSCIPVAAGFAPSPIRTVSPRGKTSAQMELAKDDQKSRSHRQPPHLIVRHTGTLRVDDSIDQNSDQDTDCCQGSAHNISVKDLRKQLVRTPEKNAYDNTHDKGCAQRLDEEPRHIVCIAEDLP
jgi:CheY-like chemotaxis protein